ncbi:MAG: C4-type zinc ribbon domain-containing protein [Polyangiaceae bacterium]
MSQIQQTQDQQSQLAKLAAVDASLKEVDEELSTAKANVTALDSSIEALKAKVASKGSESGRLEGLQKEAMLEARSMNLQLEQSREKLSRSRTEREVNAVQRELEELRRLMRDREVEAERLGKELEQIALSAEATRSELTKLEGERAELSGAANARIGELEGRRATLQGERETISKLLPVPLFRKYETIRQKRGTGIATTTTGNCSACNIALPPQLFHRLRREPLIEQCQSCNRLIFYVPPAPAATPAAT